MKKEERLLRAIGEVDDELVAAAQKRPKRRSNRWLGWCAAAACVGLIVFGAWRFLPREQASEEAPANQLKGASHAQVMELKAELPTQWDEWEVRKQSRDIQPDMNQFYQQTIPAMLQSDEQNNRVYSPLNVYLALSMLAETTDGETRAQLLTLLDVPDMDTLRERAETLWLANYQDAEDQKSILANSFWLKDGISYRKETLQTLAKRYHASSFSGEMGTAEMDQALQNWVNENMGNLLEQYVSDMKTQDNTVLELLSTIYFKCGWTAEFSKEATTQETFHGAKGDTTCDMMHGWMGEAYYWGDGFAASSLYLRGYEKMYFFLPDEGVSLNDVVQNPQVMQILRESKGELYPNQKDMMVHFSMPKFNLSSKTDLIQVLRQLGVTDAFEEEKADFSNLADLIDPIYVTKAEHAATVSIDEEGVTGAAYTEIEVEAGAADPEEIQEIEFTLDRPFFYVITGADGSILFAGTAWDGA